MVRGLLARLGQAVLLTGLVAMPADAHAQRSGPSVTAPVGTMVGSERRGIRSFKGIPYAVAPQGDLRWKPPVPQPDWQEPRRVTDFGPACYQPGARVRSVYSEDIGPMSEDCLSLNVWAPEHAENAPVLVWIHGGALTNGASSQKTYDGSKMARQGIIVVSVNYRLGILGYLALPELSAESADDISGNYGLLDQIEALKWVQRNIGAFGGDPANVTIAGESAGALSVMYLMASPRARGLFAKAIAESAYMLSTPALREPAHGMPPAEASGSALQQKLGAADLVAMRAMSPSDLVRGAAEAAFVPWGTVDGKVLPDQLVDIFDRGEQAPVPIIAGFNSGEIRTLRILLPPKPDNAEAYEARIRAAYGELADRFLAIYPSDDVEESMLATTRDAMYGWTSERLAAKQAALGVPSYLYLFDHGYPDTETWNVHGFHGSELPYVFGTMDDLPPYWPKIPDTVRERAMSAAIMGYWVSFARTGQPTAANAPAWPRYADSRSGMVFADKPVPVLRLSGGRYALHEEVVCRRRAAGDIPWTWNTGVISPPLPPQDTRCR